MEVDGYFLTMIKDPNMKITNANDVKHFLKTKEGITSEIIKKLFDKSCFL